MALGSGNLRAIGGAEFAARAPTATIRFHLQV